MSTYKKSKVFAIFWKNRHELFGKSNILVSYFSNHLYILKNLSFIIQIFLIACSCTSDYSYNI